MTLSAKSIKSCSPVRVQHILWTWNCKFYTFIRWYKNLYILKDITSQAGIWFFYEARRRTRRCRCLKMPHFAWQSPHKNLKAVLF